MTNEEKAREIKYNSCAADCGTLISLITAALDERDAEKQELIALIHDQGTKLNATSEKLAKAVSALEFYANEQNWYVTFSSGSDCPVICETDIPHVKHRNTGGKRARATLAEIKGDV